LPADPFQAGRRFAILRDKIPKIKTAGLFLSAGGWFEKKATTPRQLPRHQDLLTRLLS